MTDKIDRFVNERWDDAKYLDGNELGDLHRETLRELGECAAEVDRLRATLDEAQALAIAAESRESDLGLQVEALKARLKLAEAVVEAARDWRFCGCDHPSCSLCRDDADTAAALAAYDAVPGDVVPQGCPFDEPTNGVIGKDVAPRPRYASGEVPMVGDVAVVLLRERTKERDYYARELDKATGMVELHVDDAAAARLLWRQSEAACAKMHAERDAAIRERDAALAAFDAVPGDS
jgi:multidrug efflux pump subunit AcrA (membrane-fusion protein)